MKEQDSKDTNNTSKAGGYNPLAFRGIDSKNVSNETPKVSPRLRRTPRYSWKNLDLNRDKRQSYPLQDSPKKEEEKEPTKDKDGNISLRDFVERKMKDQNKVEDTEREIVPFAETFKNLQKNKTLEYDPLKGGGIRDYGMDITRNKYLPESFSYLSPYDVDDLRGHGQSWSRKATYGVGRMINTAIFEAVKTGGMIGGLAYTGPNVAIKALTGDGENYDFFSDVFDNSFIQSVDELQMYVADEVLPVHFRRSVEEGGLWKQLGSVETWATTGADMAGYAAMMYGPGALLQYANLGARVMRGVGVASKAKKASQAAKAAEKATRLSGAQKSFKVIDDFGKTMSFGEKAARFGAPTTARSIDRWAETFSALIADGGNEARSAGLEFEMKLNESLASGEINQDEYNELIGGKSKAMRNTFLANIPIQIGPKMVNTRLLYGGVRRNRFNKNLIDKSTGKLTVKQPKTWDYFKDSAKALGASGLRSTWELPAQIAAREFYVDNPDASFSDFLSSFAVNYLDALNTNDGKQALFFAQFTGSFAGVRSSIRNTKAEYQSSSALSELANNNLENVWKKFNGNVFELDSRGERIPTRDEKGNIIKEDGNIIFEVNEDKVAENVKILNELGYLGGQFDKAVRENDEEAIEYIRNKAQLHLIAPFVMNDQLGLGLLRESLELSDNMSEFAEQSGLTKKEVIDEILNTAEYLRTQSKIFDAYGETALNLEFDGPENHADYASYLNGIKNTYMTLKHDENFFKRQKDKLTKEFSEAFEGESVSIEEYLSHMKGLQNLEAKVMKKHDEKYEAQAEKIREIQRYEELQLKIFEGKYRNLDHIGLSLLKDLPNRDTVNLTDSELAEFRDLYIKINKDALTSELVDVYNSTKLLENNPTTGKKDVDVTREVQKYGNGYLYTFEKVDANGKPTGEKYKEYKNAKEVLRDLQSHSKESEKAQINKEAAKELRRITKGAKSIKLTSLAYNANTKNGVATFLVDGKKYTISGLETNSKLASRPLTSRESATRLKDEYSQRRDEVRRKLKTARKGKNTDTINQLEKELQDLNEKISLQETALSEPIKSLEDRVKELDAENKKVEAEYDADLKEQIKKYDESKKELADFRKKMEKDARFKTYSKKINTFENALDKNAIQVGKIWDREAHQSKLNALFEQTSIERKEQKAREEKELSEQIKNIKEAKTLEELKEALGDSKNKKVLHEANKRSKEIKDHETNINNQKGTEEFETSEEVTKNEDGSELGDTDPARDHTAEPYETDTTESNIDNPNTYLPENSGTAPQGNVGGTRLLGLNNDGTRPSYISQEFANWQLQPRDKRGTEVTFNINPNALQNIPKTHNLYSKFKQAIDIVNNKIVNEEGEVTLTKAERDLIIDFLPIDGHVGNGVYSPIATRPVAITNNAQSKFVNNDRVLRSLIIEHLIKNKTLEGFKTEVEGQYVGKIKIDASHTPGKATMNNIFDLYEFTNKETGKPFGEDEKIAYIKENIAFVDSLGNLVKLNGDKIPNSSLSSKVNIPKGEVYLMLTAANGEKYPVKMNVEKMSETHADLVSSVYEAMFRENLDGGSRINDITDPALKEAVEKGLTDSFGEGGKVTAKELFDLFGKRKSDITLDDIVNFFTFQNSTSPKSRIGFRVVPNTTKRDAFMFGGKENEGKWIKTTDKESFNKEEVSKWLQTNKRYGINMRTPKNTSRKDNMQSNDNYLKFILNNLMLNTNGVVGEPLFSAGYSGVYLKVPGVMKQGPSNTSTVKRAKPPTNIGKVEFSRKVDKSEKGWKSNREVREAKSLKVGEVFQVHYTGEKTSTVTQDKGNVTVMPPSGAHPLGLMGLTAESLVTTGKVVPVNGYETTAADNSFVLYVIDQTQPHEVVATSSNAFRSNKQIPSNSITLGRFKDDAEAKKYFDATAKAEKAVAVTPTQEVAPTVTATSITPTSRTAETISNEIKELRELNQYNEGQFEIWGEVSMMDNPKEFLRLRDEISKLEKELAATRARDEASSSTVEPTGTSGLLGTFATSGPGAPPSSTAPSGGEQTGTPGLLGTFSTSGPGVVTTTTKEVAPTTPTIPVKKKVSKQTEEAMQNEIINYMQSLYTSGASADLTRAVDGIINNTNLTSEQMLAELKSLEQTYNRGVKKDC